MSTNYCKYYDGISYCDVFKSPKKQETCRHYDKAKFFKRCMYLKFDKNCDYLKAQNDRDGLLSDEQVAEIEQSQIS